MLVNRTLQLFRIKAGHHRSNPWVMGLLFKGKLEGRAFFSQGCDYQFDNAHDQATINKLIGFNSGIGFHHQNSARIGWTHIGEGKINLFAYIYVNGERRSSEIGQVSIFQEFKFRIEQRTNHYMFQVNNRITYVWCEKKSWVNFRYLLKPYFGGKVKAPCDIEIFIEL